MFISKNSGKTLSHLKHSCHFVVGLGLTGGNQLSSIHDNKGGPATKTYKCVRRSLTCHRETCGIPCCLLLLSPIVQVHSFRTRLAFCCEREELGRNGIAEVPLLTLLAIIENGPQRKYVSNMQRKRLPPPSVSRCRALQHGSEVGVPEFESAMRQVAGAPAVLEQY